MESEQESNSTETNLDPDPDDEQEQDNHHYDDRSTALKDIVEEGVDARNVLSWRVPNEPSPSPQGKLFTSTNSEKRKKKKLRNSFNLGDNVSNVSVSNVMGNNSNSSSRVHRMNALMYETGSDTQSEDSRSHFQSRLWRFLFSNITRAVDELYNLCEDENNREYCMEGIKMFDNCKNDFHKLIERMEDQKRFEEGGQVGGVSWEVRKSSSGKRRVLSSVSVYVYPLFVTLCLCCARMLLVFELCFHSNACHLHLVINCREMQHQGEVEDIRVPKHWVV